MLQVTVPIIVTLHHVTVTPHYVTGTLHHVTVKLPHVTETLQHVTVTHSPYYAHSYHRGNTTLTDQRRTTPWSGRSP